MAYKQLDYLTRCKIFGLWRAGLNQTEIANDIGVHKSTISRELNRNITLVRTTLGSWQYKPDYAQTYAETRRKEKPKRIKFTKEVEQFIREKLQEEWSPEQISGYAKCHKLFSLSHERIYQFILADKNKGGQLYKHLRHQHKKYRKRYGSPDRQGPIKNRIMIDDRPKIVEEKKRLGDWEIDTIIGKEHQKAIVTLVERVSKKTLIGQVGSKKADFVSAQIVRLLTEIKPYVLTITADNGSEFAQHEWVSTVLEAAFYFAHPYHSWERGLNENTNGLIRQYIPKGKDFTELTDSDIIKIQGKLNNRPRKSLGFATPNEVFEKLQKQAF
ncbi:MAG: IS30 family transposase [Gammaproteobacteria bacterium]